MSKGVATPTDIFKKCYEFNRDLEITAAGLYPFFKVISGNHGNRVVIDGREVVMAGSNNYLGLTRHPKVVEAAIKATEKYGTSCSGSRYANGTYDLHVELEEKLAKWMGREKALCFTTGYLTNQGAISALGGRHDVIFSDKENHACIVDATRLSFGEVKRYAHGDMDDLERQLQETPEDSGRLIVTDGVFSMRGTIVNLPRMVELKKKYGARIYIDDAHGLGVLGKKGRGTGEHFNLHDDVDVVMGTFSKSFAGLGGFVCGEERVISWIKHKAQQLIFAAAMTPASTAAVLTVLELIQKEPSHLANLHKISTKVRDGFRAIGFDVPDGVTPILYTRVGEDVQAFQFWKDLLELGVYTNPVITPGVPVGWSGVRSSYMSIHTDADIDHVVNAFAKVGKKYGLI
ncbi:MAG: aminotransferase class I/II-fold pyridoxal phosphate-dependent enzyme [Planctomycetes bacterium]|nr:aminotransferase class I/II-fold pyridoxal phosphate-dependent enzyme [Planctomycetota bacterium]NUQ34602.1 aminotransferase class I/II-fold pyridoxal phosphate-dependent enzyme [Planctomycetaceae bacterium]